MVDKLMMKSAEKLQDGIVWFFKTAFRGLAGMAINELDAVFVLVAIIGIYFMMAGNKKLGTKLTSGSFLTYTILKAVFKV